MLKQLDFSSLTETEAVKVKRDGEPSETENGCTGCLSGKPTTRKPPEIARIFGQAARHRQF
jgi:hypothetical protein